MLTSCTGAQRMNASLICIVGENHRSGLKPEDMRPSEHASYHGAHIKLACVALQRCLHLCAENMLGSQQ